MSFKYSSRYCTFLLGSVPHASIIQSIPSKKAEPLKQWLAEVGSQRIDQMQDPELSIEQAVRDNMTNVELGRKIRDNELKRIPYMVIVGEKEAADGTVAVRPQGGGEQTVMTIQQFIDHINAEVKEMTKDF